MKDASLRTELPLLPLWQTLIHRSDIFTKHATGSAGEVTMASLVAGALALCMVIIVAVVEVVSPSPGQP